MPQKTITTNAPHLRSLSDTRYHHISTVVLATTFISLTLTACQQPPSPAGWSITDLPRQPDTAGEASDTLSDTSPDTSRDATDDADSPPWVGWYRTNADDGPAFFVRRPSGLHIQSPPDSHGCHASITPDTPRWALAPPPLDASTRRFLLPDAVGDIGIGTFSNKRLGFLTVDGNLDPNPVELPGGIVAQIDDASLKANPCKTLDALGRCGVPEPGDVCYNGVTDAFEKAPRISVYEAGMAGPRGPTNFHFRTRLHTNVADAGTSIVVNASFPALGPADRPIEDWTVRAANSFYMERVCASFAGGVAVRYPHDHIEGWVHEIPAREHDGDKNLALFNLRATDGHYQPAPPAGSDAGMPHVNCSRGPLEFWTTIAYE